MVRGHAWQGGMHGRGCMAGGMHGRGMHVRVHAWQVGVCMAGGMHGGGHAWHGGVHGRGACMTYGQ